MNPIRGYMDGMAASYATATFLTPVQRTPQGAQAPARAAMRDVTARPHGTALRFLTSPMASKLAMRTGGAALALLAAAALIQ
ncbi:hypothetical protein M2A_0250 [Tepidicaulis marinus]|uniref:Uncharacterized protein n=1 Tax=Tepidicaulis marinus TaxID=1333998 RepID=A0A081B6T3_9HYPH|nr:hypothetical protein [Tepidicaulis marinus]GAK43751.1 hypothetical protein M2A_0250 [Tepidicaulis marinus]